MLQFFKRSFKKIPPDDYILRLRSAVIGEGSCGVENVHRFLLPGGYVLLDDSRKGLSMGSARLAQEIIQLGQYERSGVNPNYLFRKI